MDLPIERLHDRAEFEAAVARATDRIAFEQLLQQAYAAAERWALPAICQACGNPVALIADRQHSYDGGVNFRERLECPVCHLNTRQRFMAHLVREAVAGLAHTPRIYLYEQVTPFFHWARASLAGEVLGSEYLGHDVAGGAVIQGVRHEDALALSFGNASLDLIVSQDVMEHVPEIEPAIAEAARVLRPGGRFYFSVPFDPASDTTVQRAKLIDGDVVHREEPVFHGNPVSPEGSLVFFDHGWDLIDRLGAHGFADACVLGTWSALYGYLSRGLVTVFSARRAG